MSKMYYINKTLNNSAKNKLDEALHRAFNRVINHQISEENIPVMEAIFNNTVEEYRKSGGRCQPWKYSLYKPAGDREYANIYFRVSETCSFLLEEIRGEVLPF